MALDLLGKTSLITGASRGIGAATAIKLAELGSNIILNFRSKAPRAQQVVEQIRALGREVMPAQADITRADEVTAMLDAAGRQFGQLDYLILNASGGMEKDRAEDYAMVLNRDAQIGLVSSARPWMPADSRIIFVTSHSAHFYGSKPVMNGYEEVARSKRAGEDALRGLAAELASQGVSFVVVSGDVIEGTITPRLLERQSPGMLEARRKEAGGLPTVDDFATAIVQAATDVSLLSGATIFVGAVD